MNTSSQNETVYVMDSDVNPVNSVVHILNDWAALGHFVTRESRGQLMNKTKVKRTSISISEEKKLGQLILFF